jgi:hypothetical protein
MEARPGDENAPEAQARRRLTRGRCLSFRGITGSAVRGVVPSCCIYYSPWRTLVKVGIFRPANDRLRDQEEEQTMSTKKSASRCEQVK